MAHVRQNSLAAELPTMTSCLSESVLPAPIRYELGDGHTYEFVEGTIPHPMAPGMFKLPHRYAQASLKLKTLLTHS